MNLATGELLKEAAVMHSLLDDLPQGEQVAEDLRRSYVSIQATIEVLAQRTRTGHGGAGAVYQLDKMLERRSRLARQQHRVFRRIRSRGHGRRGGGGGRRLQLHSADP